MNSLAAGSRVGPYEIRSLLGEGGMGQVWRAHDTRLERDVALKVLPAEALGDETARARLVREARLASKLNHPHICTIYDIGEAEGRTYIAMELVEGHALSTLIAAGSLSIDQILRYGQQMTDALAHAHGRGVVHRDFKSPNVIVTPEGHVKVLDFGLAKRLAGEHLADATTASRHSLTAAGVVAGTLAYMAPEQLRGQPADARSDIWALGIVLYELAAGKRPFEGRTGFELTAAILTQPVPAVPSSLPAPLAAVIDRCLAKDPGERYQQCAEVRAALDAVASGQAPAPGRAASGTLEPARVIKLAVLPLANLSGDPDQEYLSDGLTQEMITQLGRLHPQTLSVIARTSVMRYKRTETPIDQIGRELGVQYILEGSAQREAGRIRVAAELIKVKDQTQLWADTYERELAGVLALQSEVARRVAVALALKLLPAEQARLANVRPVNPEAYEAYLKGLQRWYNLTLADVDAALQYFALALDKDPAYALAHVGVSLVWVGRQQMGVTPPHEAGPKAKASALKALELDDSIVEAHYALALVKAWTDWDWPGAETAFKRAIALNPSFPDVAAFYSHYLHIMRRPDEAMAEIERAVALDPFNELFRAFYAIDLVMVRRYDEAVVQARAVLRTVPNHGVGLNALWLAFSLMGREDEACSAAKAYLTMMYDDRTVADALDSGLAEGGYRQAMKRAAEIVAARCRTSFASPFDVTQLYVAAGENSQALDWLEYGCDVHDPNTPYVGALPFDGLRSDPRYQALLRRIGLPQ